MRRCAVGRADLLFFLGAAGEPGVAAMAELAGFTWRPAPDLPAPRPSACAPRTAAAPLPAADPAPLAVSAPVTGLTFYRVTDRQPLPRTRPAGERPAWAQRANPVRTDADAGAGAAPPEPEPLVHWRRLWPFLRAALGQPREERTPDLARIVELAARGQVPRRLPRRRRHHWAPGCRVILDFSPHLEPFHADLRGLIRPLSRLRGPFGLTVLCTTAGPAGPFIQVLDERRERLVPVLALPGADCPVLVVSDLGCYGEPARRAAWSAFGRRLRRAGLYPVALLPCPPRFWDPALAGLWFPVTWDRTHRLPARLGGPRPWPAAPAPLAEDPGARRLLDLLAPAIRLEPALLRALRHRLGGTGLDAGAEAAAWLHPDLEHRHGAAQWAGREHWEERRRAYPNYPAAERLLAAALLRRHHRHLARCVGAEEAAHLAQLLGEEDPDATHYLADTLRTLEEPADDDQGRRLRQYAGRLGERQPASAWHEERLAAIWVRANRDDLLADRCALPPGLDLSVVDWVLAGDAPPRVWTLIQQGQGLALMLNPPLRDALEPGADAGADLADPIPGSPLAHLRLADAPVQYAPLDDPHRQCSAPPGVQIPLTGAGIILRAYDAVLTIEPLTKPDWAQAIGRDGSGLYVDIAQGQGTRRLRWVSPGDALGIATAMEIRDLPTPRAAFWDALDYREWRHGELARPAWAQRVGRDEYGLWAEFAFKGVTQRLRWLWPGEFTMGSPADEPERRDNERQHQVLLTHGLWLADTACTQALWLAVMGVNPSLFKLRADSPVEQVTWEDVQAFIGRLNAAVPGLDLRLPTEAEWEYACRAGTETPFAFGQTITTNEVNYNSFTATVKARPCNAWGLYQMHGNLWEWCQDWYADYPERTAIDPSGAETGNKRVARGGSAFGPAGDCRSAQRFPRWPDGRSGHVGFRLARGPQARPAEPGPSEAEWASAGPG